MSDLTRRSTIASLAALAISTNLVLAEDEDAGGADDAENSAPKQPERTLTNIRLIFQGLPPELHPHPKNGWDKFELPKVKAWLDLTWVDRPVKISRRLHRVDVRSNFGSKSPDNAWAASFNTASDSINFRGIDIKCGFGEIGWPHTRFTFVGDEDFAKRCERIPNNKVVVLTGQIENVQLITYQPSEATIHFDLKNFAMPGTA